MKYFKNNLIVSTIIFILVVSISTVLIAFPVVSAQPGTTWPTYSVCDVIPNKTGVNQAILVSMGITRQTAWPQSGWSGITISVTLPDGTSETLGPFNTDTTGLTGRAYIPTMVGTYTFVSNYPEQEIEVGVAGIETGTTMLASYSATVELTVTQESLEHFPAAPLPTESWTRPIDAQNREWFQVSGSYLDGNYYRSSANRFVPFNDGPETSHILYEKVQDMGGLAGGDRGPNSFESGDAYEGKWQNPMIISGILVGVRYVRGTQVTYAINLRTGEELWEKALGDEKDLAVSPSFGQLFYWDTLNMHGCYSYIWATQGQNWHAFDPLTGRWEYTMTNVPSGTRVPGPNGEVLLYNVDGFTGWMSMWNSTAAYYQMRLDEEGDSPLAVYESGRWRPTGMEFDASHGTQWNVSIPTDLPNYFFFGGPAYVELVIPMDRVIGGNTEWAGGTAQQNPEFWAINIKPGYEGELIFRETWPVPDEGVHYDFAGSHPFSVEYDVFIVTGKETRTHYGISMTTGKQLWATDHFEPYNNAFANVYLDPWGQEVCADDKLITAGFGGHINAYSLVDGSHQWEYILDNQYGEFLFGNAWSSPTGFITDGKVYLFHTEHSVINPMPRGAPTACISLDTGEEIWRANGLRLGTRWGGQPIIGDSVIVGFGSYDNTINAIGKGPSELTVSVPDPTVSLGDEVWIQGNVMDVSPGTKDSEQILRFANGVPAISDAYMSEWMLYVYKERPRPISAIGVSVNLEAIDPNGNYQNLGLTTSDIYGNYGFAFEPETEGTYMIISTFEGSGAYYGSISTTFARVGAASPSTPIEPEQPVPEAPLITSEIAIIAAIVIAAIIGVAAFWALKRK